MSIVIAQAIIVLCITTVFFYYLKQIYFQIFVLELPLQEGLYDVTNILYNL